MNPSDSFIQGFFEKCAANGIPDIQAAALYEVWLEKVAAAARRAEKDKMFAARRVGRVVAKPGQQQPQQSEQQKPIQIGLRIPKAPEPQQPQQPEQQPQQQNNGGGGLFGALKGAWDGIKGGVNAIGNTINNTIGFGAMENAGKGGASKMLNKLQDKNQGFLSKAWNRSLPGMAWNMISGAASGYGQGAREALYGKSAAAIGLYKAAAAQGLLDPAYVEEMEKQAMPLLMKALGTAAGFAAKRLPGMMAAGGKMLAQAGKQGFNLAQQGAGMAKNWMQTSGMDYMRKGMEFGKNNFNNMKDKAQAAWQNYQANAPARAAASEAFKQKMRGMASSAMTAGKGWLQNQGNSFMDAFNSYGANDSDEQEQ